LSSGVTSGAGGELRERQEPSREVFSPFAELSPCHFTQAEQSRAEQSRAGSTATASACEEVSHGNCGLDRERSLLFPASSAGERELESAEEKRNQRRNKMEGSRKRGERDRAELRLTAKAASSGVLRNAGFI